MKEERYIVIKDDKALGLCFPEGSFTSQYAWVDLQAKEVLLFDFKFDNPLITCPEYHPFRKELEGSKVTKVISERILSIVKE